MIDNCIAEASEFIHVKNGASKHDTIVHIRFITISMMHP